MNDREGSPIRASYRGVSINLKPNVKHLLSKESNLDARLKE